MAFRLVKVAEREDGLDPVGKKGSRPSCSVLQAVRYHWGEVTLPAELLMLPVERARVNALLDDSAFFAPFVLGSVDWSANDTKT